MAGTGERKQLRGQPVGRLQPRDDGREAFAHARWIGLAQCVFSLREQHSQRRAHLMRCIGEELALGLRQFCVALDVVVDRLHQRAHLGRYVCGIEWPQVVRSADCDAPRQTIQRPQRHGHAQPEQRRAHHHQRRIAQQRATPDGLLQRTSRLDGLSHLDHDARRQPRLIQRLGDGGHAHRFAVIQRVVEELGVVLQARGGQRQVVIPGEGGFGRLTRRGLEGNAVIDAALRGRLEHRQRHIRHVDLHLAALDRHAVLDGAHRAEQGTVVRAVGGAAQRLVRAHDVDCQHADQPGQQ